MMFDPELPGPYELMWLSDRECPVFEDVGLGIGCLKVKGNSQFSVSLCPAARISRAEIDPIRKWWQPHGLSPVEPAVESDPLLRIIQRGWQPHMLQSMYRLGETAIHQSARVFQYGTEVVIDPESAIPLFLKGASAGACKVWRIPDGLHIVETKTALRPLEYEIRFDPAPERIAVAQEDIARSDSADVFTREAGTDWTFYWETPINHLTAIVSVVSDGTGLRESREPKIGTAELSECSWRSYYSEGVPRLTTPDKRINRLCDYFAYIYRANIIRLGGILPYPFAMCKETFNGFWMWDCCFHAIGARWHADRDSVWGNLLNVENLQYPLKTKGAGCVNNSAQPYGVQMFLSDDPMSGRRASMPYLIPEEHGDGSHPPAFAQALEALWMVDGNDRNLQRLLPNALAYHDWYERTRRSKSLPGLLLARRWSDSGMDNSKRWGHQGSGIYGTGLRELWWSMPIVTVDLNIMSVLEKQSLARMYRYLGGEEKAASLSAEAEERAGLVLKQFWNEESGFFFDCDEKRGEQIPVWSPTGFFPMLLDLIDQPRIDRLLDHLFDPSRFWAKMPIPSLSMDDPDFKPSHSYWMGCTWMSYTIYILRALLRRVPDAGWKLLDTITGVLMNNDTPHIFENYNPITGEGQDCANFGWHGMITDIIITEMFGVKPRGDRLSVSECHCPDTWDRWSIDNLYYRGKMYSVRATREKSGWSATVEDVS